MIRFDGVSFTYPESPSPALADITLEIKQGEFVLVAGRSGSGKSTLLRCMNGLIPHFHGGVFAGRVTLDGRDTRKHEVREIAQTVGMVFQDPENQFVTTSVRSEIAFGQENVGKRPSDIERTTAVLANRLALADLLDRQPTEISGGEKQRTIVASALAVGTEAIALDEPTSQLDPRSTRELLEDLRSLNSEGMTVVLSEHRLSRVTKYATRTLVLEGGRLAFDGDPLELPRRFPRLVRLGKRPRRAEIPSAVRLKIRDLSFRYGAEACWVLRRLDLDLPSVGIFAIVGANGSGKSTLARVISGLVSPSEGELSLDGRRIDELRRSELARRVGIVFQDPNKHLFHDTVIEEVEFARKKMGIAGDRSIESLMDDFNLTQFSRRNPRDLSGGQKQKVAIASILSYGPEILILDEPTRGLDLQEKGELMSRLWGETRRPGTSIVLLTHDLQIVEGFADRASILSGGRISFEGRPETVVEKFTEEV